MQNFLFVITRETDQNNSIFCVQTLMKVQTMK
jgi:hypothetical protein